MSAGENIYSSGFGDEGSFFYYGGQDAPFEESKHPRDEGGKFTSGGGGGIKSINVGQQIDMKGMKKVGEQKGSNPGGVYESPMGNKFYIKRLKSNNHVRNELLAAALFREAGGSQNGRTLQYYPVQDDQDPKRMNIGTAFQKLKKDNVSQLDPDERAQAQNQFAMHAWLANWDSAGLGGDNVGVDENGDVIPLDFGGSLFYRAQGEPKGAAFNDQANEWDSLRDPKVNKDSAGLYGPMTSAQLTSSAMNLKNISDKLIHQMTAKYGPKQNNDLLADTLIKRKYAILHKAGLIKKMPSFDAKFEEAKHPRDKGGEFTAGAASGKLSPEDDKKLKKKEGWEFISKKNQAEMDFRPGVAFYGGSGNSFKINEFLRTGGIKVGAIKRTKGISEFGKSKINELTHTLRGANLKEKTQTYRGMVFPDDDPPQFKVGETFTDPGFGSTTTNKSHAEEFASLSPLWAEVREDKGLGPAPSVMMHITLPQGSQATPLFHNRENEILVQRNSTYRVDKVAKKGHQQIVHVTLVDQSAPKAIDVKFEEQKHPRDKTGEFTTGTGSHGSGVKIKKVEKRAFNGQQVNTSAQLSKLETGALGENIAISWLKEHGLSDAKALHEQTSINFPLDLVGDHEVYEIKTGLVSNGKSAQHWRATIGQPGKAEQEWLKTASADAKAQWNIEKQSAIIKRKQQVLDEFGKRLGKQLRGKTITLIINPDTKTADIHVFEGFHTRIAWNSEAGKKGYVGSFAYEHPTTDESPGEFAGEPDKKVNPGYIQGPTFDVVFA